MVNEFGEECHRPATTSSSSLSVTNENNENGLISNNSMSIEKLLIENEAFSLKYILVPNDKVFIMDQYLKEARFRENVI